MKRVIVLILIAASMLLAACAVRTDNISFTFDEAGSYTGFADLPADITAGDLEEAGYVVRQGLETVANGDVWEGFLKTAGQGNDAGVRIVSFYEDDKEGPYFTDIFFNGGQYYLFDSSSEDLTRKPYKFLLTLKGQIGNPLRDSGVVVLTDDDSLTFDDVNGSIVSSDMEYIKSIPPYRLVMFCSYRKR